jgi:hypothetical protein
MITVDKIWIERKLKEKGNCRHSDNSASTSPIFLGVNKTRKTGSYFEQVGAYK